MYWIIDVLVIIIVLYSFIGGYKRGFLRMFGGLAAFIFLPVLTLVGTAGFVLLLYKLGVVDQMAVNLLGVIGETNSLFGMMEMESYDVCHWLGIAIFAIIGIILSSILSIALIKGTGKLLKNVATKGFWKVLDGIFGVILRVAIWGALILGSFALFHALKDTFVSIDEVLRACPLSSLIYEHNPLNDLIADLLGNMGLIS